MTNYHDKYIKYKTKYMGLKNNHIGGSENSAKNSLFELRKNKLLYLNTFFKIYIHFKKIKTIYL